MNFTSGLNTLQAGILNDVNFFLPELILCVTIVLLLIARLLPSLDRVHLGWIALALTVLALVVACAEWRGYGDWIRKPEDMDLIIIPKTRTLAVVSLACWLGAIIAGRLLAYRAAM